MLPVWQNYHSSDNTTPEFYACAGSALATELHWGAFSKSEFQANLAQSGTALLEVQVIGAGQQWAHVPAPKSDPLGMQLICNSPHLVGRLSLSGNRTLHSIFRVAFGYLRTKLWIVTANGNLGMSE